MTRHPTALTISPWRPTWPTRPQGPTLRSSLGAALALLAMLGLLLIFGHVVNGAVRQGELQRAATAVHADGVWRCNGLRSRGLRDRCVAALDPADRSATPQQLAEGLRAASLER